MTGHIQRSLVVSIVIVFMSAVTLSAAWADGFYMKQKQHTDAFQMMGRTQPAKDEVTETWISGRKARFDSAEGSTVIDLDKKTMTLIDHDEKNYTEAPLGKGLGGMGTAGAEGAQDPKSKQAMQAMMAAMAKTETKVTDTGEKKKIGQWNCRKYLVETKMATGQVNSEVWASEEIKIETEVFSALQQAMSAFHPGMGTSAEEMKKIKGVQVMSKSTTQSMGAVIRSTSELSEATAKNIPADIFKVPDGYSKE
jgi:hypothetical protein